MKIDLAKLKELAEKATPGPWFENKEKEKNGYPFVTDGNTELFFSTVEGYCEDNAKFIAAANPATILALIELIEVYESVLKMYEDKTNRYVEKTRLQVTAADSVYIYGMHEPAAKALEQRKRILGE